MSGTAGLNPTDFDSFAIIVPTGDQVTLASVLLTDTVGDIVEMDWDLRKGSANFTAGTCRPVSFPVAVGRAVGGPGLLAFVLGSGVVRGCMALKELDNGGCYIDAGRLLQALDAG